MLSFGMLQTVDVGAEIGVVQEIFSGWAGVELQLHVLCRGFELR